MVLFLCTSSDCALYLYQVSWKYLKEFQSYSEFYIYTKFQEYISKGFRVIERTRFVTDRQTDNYGKNNLSPQDWRGRVSPRWWWWGGRGRERHNSLLAYAVRWNLINLCPRRLSYLFTVDESICQLRGLWYSLILIKFIWFKIGILICLRQIV